MNIEEIQDAITTLSAEDLSAFRAWYAKFDADARDHQFEADVKAGNPGHLRAAAGRSSEL